MRPTVRRPDPRLTAIRKAIHGLIPGSTPAFLSLQLTEQFPRATSDTARTWDGDPDYVAELIFTALYGRHRLADAQAFESGLGDVVLRALTGPQIVGPEVTHDTDEPVVHFHPGPDQTEWMTTVRQLAQAVTTAVLASLAEPSPRAQAEYAKARRDLGGELAALTRAHDQLTCASWYPVRPGDLVHVHYEAGGQAPAFGETYIVGDAREPGDTAPGLLSMVLLAHTLPEATPEDDVKAMTGHFEVEAHDDPLYEPWFEAGPQRLTVIRDGRVVHNGGAR